MGIEGHCEDLGVLVVTGTNEDKHHHWMSSDGFKADRGGRILKFGREMEMGNWGFLLTPSDVEIQSYTWSTDSHNVPHCSWKQITYICSDRKRARNYTSPLNGLGATVKDASIFL